jgi:predicted metal-binding protein
VKIYAEDAADYLETLVRRYVQERDGASCFSEHVNSLDDEALARFAAPPARAGSELR